MLRWIDGFDHYGANGNFSDTNISGLYSGMNGLTDLVTNTEFGGQALNIIPGFNNQVVCSAAGSFSDGDTVGVGFRYFVETFDGKGGLVSFASGGTKQFNVVLHDVDSVTSALDITNTAGTVLATSSSSLSTDTWYHIETKMVKAANGSIEVRVNGQDFVSVTGINTSAMTNQIVLGADLGDNGSDDYYFDDLYIWDGSGSFNNDWLGERNVTTHFVNADTAQADWVLSSGSAGYDLLNDKPPAPDTNYIVSDTIADESTFEIADLAATDIVVNGIMILAEAQKDGTEPVAVQMSPIVAGSDNYSGDMSLSQDTPTYYKYIVEASPATGSLFSPAEINSLQIGVKRTV